MKTKKDVRKICGLANYYRRFIPFFAKIMSPLTNLTKGSYPNTVHWTTDCETAFNHLKQAMCSNPVLILPDLNQRFVVRSDASAKAIGAVLMQERDGILRPISYVSRKLLDREQNYPICEKESLGVVFALHKFARYLLMRQFTLQVDSKVLTVLKKNKSLNPRLLRWSLAIQGFNYDLQHIPGPQNRISDILSRF